MKVTRVVSFTKAGVGLIVFIIDNRLYCIITQVLNAMTMKKKTIFAHTVNLKLELLTKFENKLDFFPSAKFFTVQSSTMNPRECNVVSKRQAFQDKPHVRSAA